MTRMLILCFLFTVKLLVAQTIAALTAKELEFKVDSLIIDGISQHAFPGAQVLMYKGGKVRLHKAYGHHTYNKAIEVNTNNLYDLASITKILGSTLAFMKLYEMYPLAIDQKISDFIPTLKGTNKKRTTFRDIFSHNAGWLPYLTHQNTIYNKKGTFRWHSLSERQSKRYPSPLTDQLFIHKNYPKKIIRRIKRTPVENVGEYLYSGLWYFFMPQFVKELSGMSLDKFLDNYFYKPMELKRMTFLPLKNYGQKEIIPTEIDSLFRKELVHGRVHDEAAALMGGVCGNAGLFANASSVAPLLEMLLNNGNYKGTNYLKPETIALFTGLAYPKTENRRGLGFDKPELEPSEDGSRYPSKKCSPSSFGHAGYTGTFVWVDPEHNCFLVLLSNRVYPSRTHRNLYELGIRGKLLDYVIQSN